MYQRIWLFIHQQKWRFGMGQQNTRRIILANGRKYSEIQKEDVGKHSHAFPFPHMQSLHNQPANTNNTFPLRGGDPFAALGGGGGIDSLFLLIGRDFRDTHP